MHLTQIVFFYIVLYNCAKCHAFIQKLNNFTLLHSLTAALRRTK